ncbi:MAG: PKD domain-containing protein, partial [Thermoplasmatales archaeon]|nr:PKD domain-containing protein [Thermoplasmatales archaeon]
MITTVIPAMGFIKENKKCDSYFFEIQNVVSNNDLKSENLNILDQIDQQQTVDSGVSWSISEYGYYAQSFTPALGQLTRVELKLYKKGTPDGLKISIRSSLTGSDLTSKYLLGSSISTSANWHEFNFPDITVTTGNTYYIVWDPVGAPDFNNNFYLRVGAGNPYISGSAWIYLGSIWEVHDPPESPNPDFCFKTYGISGGGNNPPNKPTTPSGPTTGNVGESLHYESYISDPDGDGMEVYFDWGDGTYTGWVGILTNGTVGNYKTWTTADTYQVRVKTRDTPHLEESPWSDSLSVIIGNGGNTQPNKPETPDGPTSGKTGTSYSYSSSTTDPDGDQVWYKWDWGDEVSNWDGPYNSGDLVTQSHIWSNQGTYAVKVKAKDTSDVESVWSDPLPISMPKNKQYMPLGIILAFGFDVDV